MTDAPWETGLLVPPTYLNVILRDLEPAVAKRVLDEAGLPERWMAGSAEAVPIALMQAAVTSLRGIIGEHWHLKMIHRLNLFAHGSLGMAAVTCPDMGSAISILERYVTVRAPFVRLEQRLDPDRCVLRLVDEAGLGEPWRDLLEVVMLGIQSLLEQVHGSPLREMQMHFALPAPPYDSLLEEQVQGQVIYGSQWHEMVIPRSWLEKTSPMHDLAMHRSALSRLEAEFAAVAGRHSVTDLVTQLLCAAPEHPPSLGEIARGQFITSRTLIRRLKSEGSSYQKILQEVRLRQAIKLLSAPDFTVKQISYMLGYKDPSNFGRAFVLWTGQSPGEFRRSLGSD